jgi:hypothetical protein
LKGLSDSCQGSFDPLYYCLIHGQPEQINQVHFGVLLCRGGGVTVNINILTLQSPPLGQKLKYQYVPSLPSTSISPEAIENQYATKLTNSE